MGVYQLLIISFSAASGWEIDAGGPNKGNLIQENMLAHWFAHQWSVKVNVMRKIEMLSDDVAATNGIDAVLLGFFDYGSNLCGWGIRHALRYLYMHLLTSRTHLFPKKAYI